MLEAHWVWFDASMVDVIDDLTSNNWDHVFVINHEGAPQGRIHAVDVLKIIARKKVNRHRLDAWNPCTATGEPPSNHGEHGNAIAQGGRADARPRPQPDWRR